MFPIQPGVRFAASTLALSRSTLRVIPLACAMALTTANAQTVLSASSTLPETIVTATRFPEAVGSLPQSVSVVTADDIRASGATTVNEALMRILGVLGRQDLYGGGDYALDLTGFGSTADSNQVVIVDGIRINEGDLGGTRLAGIPIEAIESIEVMRGNAAVLYGEGATGGAIVLTTKAGAGKARRNSAAVQVGVGSLGVREARASATLASGAFSLDVSGQKRDSDNHRANFRSQADGSNLVAQWAQENVRVGVRYGEDRLDTGLPGALSAAQYAADPRQASSLTDHANIRNERTGLFAEAILGDWQLLADAGWRKKALRSVSYDYDVDATNYAVRARHEAKFGKVRNALVIGSDHGQWTRNTLGQYGSQSRQTTEAWYLKDDVTFPTGTRLSAGWRSEQLDKSSSGTALNDRLNAWDMGLSQALAQDVTAWGRVGTSYRLANVDEFTFVAAALRPQTSRDTEVGTRWKLGADKVEARLYRSLLTDELGYDGTVVNSNSWNGFGANVNFDPTRHQGIEVDGTYAVHSHLKFRAVAGLRQAKFRAGTYVGKDVPLSPKQTLALRADWTPLAQHRVSGGVNWVSSMHPGSDFTNQCKMPSHVKGDVRYAYQLRNMEFAVGVNNVTDQKYYTQAYSCSGGVVGGIYPEAGRTVHASLRLSY